MLPCRPLPPLPDVCWTTLRPVALCFQRFAYTPGPEAMYDLLETTRFTAVLSLEQWENRGLLRPAACLRSRAISPDAAGLQHLCLHILPKAPAGVVLLCSSGHFWHVSAVQPLAHISPEQARVSLLNKAFLVYVDVRAKWACRALLASISDAQWLGLAPATVRGPHRSYMRVVSPWPNVCLLCD